MPRCRTVVRVWLQNEDNRISDSKRFQTEQSCKMVQEVDSWFVLKDDTRLFEKTWKPSDPPKAHLIFIHGFSDRSEIQYHLFPTLASPPYNIACHAIDQRGWGKSVHHPSQRGHTGTTDQVLSDIDEYVAHVVSQTPTYSDQGRPSITLMGHSMGGQQVLHYILSTSSTYTTSRSYLAGAIIEAPYLALDPSSQPSSFIIAAGRIAAMISPRSQMKQHLDSQYITRDPEVNQAWKSDPLCHDYGTLEGLRDMLRRGADLIELGRLVSSRDKRRSVPAVIEKTLGLRCQVTIPVLWAHGTHDRVTSFDASKRLYDALKQVQSSDAAKKDLLLFKAYEGAYHKIHAEPDGVGVDFSREVGQWILDLAEGKEGVHQSSQYGAENWNKSKALNEKIKSKL